VAVVTDDEALAAFSLCARLEGILPALEPCHAIAQVAKTAPAMGKDEIVVMNLCGRGDKDVATIRQAMGVGR
jgi:tryptophan synthase beta chain